MAYEIFLPEDKNQRERTLNRIISVGEVARHIPEVAWWLAHHYLQGARNFRSIDYQSGTVEVGYDNVDGEMQFRYDDIVSKFQAQVGRMLQIDINPQVEKKGIGLEGLRNASISQVALNAAFPPAKVDELKLQMLAPLTKYGLVGLAVWNEEEDVGVDVVMPWELLPIPPVPTESKDIRGIARVRVVPLDWVKKLSVTPKDTGKKDNIYSKMTKQSMPVGQLPTTGQFSTFTGSVALTADIGDAAGPRYGSANVKSVGPGQKNDKENVDVVKFVEVWMKDSRGYLAQYDILAGDKLIYTLKSKEYEKNIMPIHICNDIDTGSFWGRSFVSLQMPLNMEMEWAVGRMFQNVQDVDNLGILCEPTTSGMPTEIFRGQDGIKRARFEPDYSVPDLKPFVLQPTNTGTWPIETLKMGVALSDKIANQPTEMMGGGAPGRVDSQAGLGFLYEVSNIPLGPTAQSISQAVSGCYRAILDIVRMKWPKQKMVQVSLLDDSLAGITLDAKTGTMELSDNGIPHPDEVKITIRAMLPKSKEQEKMELAEALKMGTIDMFEYRIMVRKKGLELPVGNEPEWQNYRRAMLENIILFGDGEKPGQVIVSPLDIHDVHMRVLQAFMARPEFYEASTAIREKFIEHYSAHLLATGSLPDQMPYVEQAAQEEAVRTGVQKAPAQQGAGGP